MYWEVKNVSTNKFYIIVLLMLGLLCIVYNILFIHSSNLTEIEQYRRENREENLENVYFERSKKMMQICQKYNLTGKKVERKGKDIFYYILCFNEFKVNILELNWL